MGIKSIWNRLVYAAFAVAVIAAQPALAEVSLKNGNFFVGYTDIVYPGGFEPKIERVYNSKTPYKGIFGFGWGNEYEVYLRVSADGSVVVHEYGGGAENRFNPVAFKPEELDKAVETIANAAVKAGAIAGTGDVKAKYIAQLKSNAMFRNDEWEKYLRIPNSGLKPRELAVGTQLQSNKFSYQYITRVADGYVRVFDNGRMEKFDNEGRLRRVSDKNKNFIDFHYGKDKKLEKVVDNFNRKMFFTFNNRGLVQKIEGENKKVATYDYNANDELVKSVDAAGNAYTFKYSPDKHHNMIEIGYGDKTTQQIAYYGRDQFESVKSVKARDGSLTTYTYQKGSEKGHTIVGSSIVGADKKPISKSRYEYFVRTKADGEEWTYKMITDLDGDRTETTYNECCGLPLLIKRGSDETAFEYDTKGRVTKKTTPTEVTELSYDQSAGKVSKVARFSKVNKSDSSWSTFQYDSAGNLKFAKNSDKKAVQLFYDANGRILSMVDQDKRKIEFEYDHNSKPVVIKDPAVGSITVSYTNSGEIKKVESTAGRKIALQVTSAFQNLLDIIRPAGVTLSF